MVGTKNEGRGFGRELRIATAGGRTGFAMTVWGCLALKLMTLLQRGRQADKDKLRRVRGRRPWFGLTAYSLSVLPSLR